MSLSLALLCVSIFLPSPFALFLGFVLYFLVKDKRFYLIVLSLLLLLYYLPLFSPYHLVKVEKISYRTQVRGINYYAQMATDDQNALDDLILLKARLPYPSDKTAFLGTIEQFEVIKRFRFFSLQRLMNKIHPQAATRLFNPSEHALIRSYALPFTGLLALVSMLSRRFYGHFNLRKPLICFYGLFFKRSQSWWNQFLKSFHFDQETRALVLLILYRHAYRNPFFVLVFFPGLLKQLSFAHQKLNHKILQIMSSLYCFGKFDFVFYLLYPLLKLYYGLRFILLCLSFVFKPLLAIVEVIDHYILRFFQTAFVKRFTLYGRPGLWALSLFLLLKSLKSQIIFAVCLALFLTYPPYASVTFIDVGQGDSTLITLPFNSRAYLFDTGRYFAKDKVIQAVHKQGLGKLDTLIISHDDADHNENQDELMAYFNIDHLITEKQAQIDFMQVLLFDEQFEDANENSLILAFNFYGLTYLMTGDAYKKQEQYIMQKHPYLQVDILKLGHHGSHTSSDPEFLKAIRPDYAIASSRPQIYNHPHPEVKKTLYHQNITLLQTSELGDIKIISFPFVHIIKTSRGGFAIIKQGDRHAQNFIRE